MILDSRRKYSCCYYDDDRDSLALTEERALTITAEHALLACGQDILELGCGWGSLSLRMAQKFPLSGITSNSASQREVIVQRARMEGLENLPVITANINDFCLKANSTAWFLSKCSNT